MSVIKDEVNRAIAALECAFDWDSSIHGREYWETVTCNLRELLATPEPRKPVEAWAVYCAGGLFAYYPDKTTAEEEAGCLTMGTVVHLREVEE